MRFYANKQDKKDSMDRGNKMGDGTTSVQNIGMRNPKGRKNLIRSLMKKEGKLSGSHARAFISNRETRIFVVIKTGFSSREHMFTTKSFGRPKEERLYNQEK